MRVRACACVCARAFFGDGTRQLSLDKLRMTFGELYKKKAALNTN